MSTAYRQAGKSGHVAYFCERCGRVEGPLPFGRGEISLTNTGEGMFCQDHMPRIRANTRPAVAGITRSVQRQTRVAVDLSALRAYLETR